MKDNVVKYFIDSNIWLYYFISSKEKEKNIKAKKLIRGLEKDRNIIISTQIINEVCSNLIRKASFDEDSIERVIFDFYEEYEVHNLSKDVLLKASEIRDKHQFSFWDSIIAASALLSDCRVLYSEDMQHGFILENQLAIKNPFIEL